MKNTFKVFGIIALVAIIGFSFAACSDGGGGNDGGNSGNNGEPVVPPGPDATSLSISPTSDTIKLGETLKPTITIKPSDAPIINWVSNDTDVATVGSDGTISSKRIGKAIVTVTAKGGKTATCTINVEPDVTKVANFNFDLDFKAIVYGDGRFVASRRDGKIAWSDNGIDWTEADSKFTNTDDIVSIIYDIAYGNGVFVVVGCETLPGQAWNISGYKLVYSDTRGTSWTIGTTDKSGQGSFSTVTFGNNIFLAGGSGGLIISSQDGKTWKTAATDWGNSNRSAENLAYGNNKFIATGEYGNIAYSSDNGANWTILDTEKRPFGNSSVKNIVFGNGKFVAICDDLLNTVAYSTDGENWTAVTSQPVPFFANSPKCITYGDGIFIGGGSFKFEYSRDGISWSRRTVLDEGSYAWVVIGNGMFLGNYGKTLIYAPVVLK